MSHGPGMGEFFTLLNLLVVFAIVFFAGRKGIAADVIDQLLSEYSAQLEDPDRAVDLLRKQAWRYRSLERDKAQRRMLGFLARRGYDGRTAWESIEHVWKEIEEDEV